MALSGTLRKQIKSDLAIRIVWSATQNEAKNTSTVTAKIQVERKYSMYSTINYYLNLDGTTKSGSYRIDTSSGGTYTLATVTKTITHTSTGTGTFKLGGYVDFRSTNLSGTTINKETIATKTLTLNEITRVAKASINNFNLDNPARITITNPKASYRVSAGLYYKNNHIKNWGISGMQDGRSYDLTVDPSDINAVLDDVPNADKAEFTVRVWTYDSGGRLVGRSYSTAIGTFHSSIKPRAGNLELTEMNSRNDTGNFLQLVSDIRMQLDATYPARGSTIKEVAYYIKNGGTIIKKSTVKPTASARFNNINYTGSARFIAVVTDSRGRKTQTELTKYISAYRYPVIKKATAERAKGTSLDPTGTNILINITARGASVSGGNPLNFIVYYRPTGSTSWTRYTSWSNTSMSWNSDYKTSTTIRGKASIESSYEVRIMMSDKFDRSEWVGEIPNGQPLMVYTKEGVAFNGFPSTEAPVSFNSDIAIKGKIKHFDGNSSQNHRASLASGASGSISYRMDPLGGVSIWGKITLKNTSLTNRFAVWASIPSAYAPAVIYCFSATDWSYVIDGLAIKSNGDIIFMGSYDKQSYKPELNKEIEFCIYYKGKGAF